MNGICETHGRIRCDECAYVTELTSAIETKEQALQQSRKAMIAALKHIDGTAVIFSHRTKSAVLYQLREALKPLNYPLPNDDVKGN